jgi:hypothetical protein
MLVILEQRADTSIAACWRGERVIAIARTPFSVSPLAGRRDGEGELHTP